MQYRVCWDFTTVMASCSTVCSIVCVGTSQQLWLHAASCVLGLHNSYGFMQHRVCWDFTTVMASCGTVCSIVCVGTSQQLRLYLQEKSLNTTHECKGMTFLRNVRNHKPSHTATYPRRLKSSNRLSLYVITLLVVFCSQCFNSAHFQGTTELHLSGLIGRASHPDMQRIRIIGCFFEK
jgi:hypothetical protein